MTSEREILTLQFGNYANYVGASFWNLQESSFNYDPTSRQPSSINHNVLYRAGKNLQGDVTYTPRLLFVDLNGTLKHMPADGGLYSTVNFNQLAGAASQDAEDKLETAKSFVEWDQSRVEVIQKPTASKPEFQQNLDKPEDDVEMSSDDYNLKETVQNWPDFLYTRYHPRSINILQQYEYSDTENPMDTFTNGYEVWRNEYFDDDFCDKIRSYIEECEHTQGFQNIFDCTDGFAGMSTKCMEHLCDDYSKPVLSVPLISPKVLQFKNSDAPMTDSIRLVNIAMSFVQMNEYSSLFVPLSTMQRGWRSVDQPRSFPRLSYDPRNLYQTSAILATYLDTISTRYRLKDGSGGDLGGLCNDMNGYGRKMAAAGLALPFPMKASEDLLDALDGQDQPLFTQLSPNTTVGTDRVVQSLCVRGLPTRRLKRPRTEATKKQMQMAAYRCDSISEMFQLYYQCNYYASMTHVTSIEDSTKVQLPYPQEIFKKELTCDGFIDDNFQRIEGSKITDVPTMATLQSSTDLYNTLDSLCRDVARVKIAKIHRFAETGLEAEEHSENIEKLHELKEKYEDNIHL